MGFEAITNLISTKLALVATANSYTVRYDNDPTATPQGNWILAQIQFGSKNRIESPSLDRTIGQLHLEVKTEYGRGSAPALAIADVISLAFEGIALNNVKFNVPRVIVVGRVDNDFQINVICPFHADE